MAFRFLTLSSMRYEIKSPDGMLTYDGTVYHISFKSTAASAKRCFEVDVRREDIARVQFVSGRGLQLPYLVIFKKEFSEYLDGSPRKAANVFVVSLSAVAQAAALAHEISPATNSATVPPTGRAPQPSPRPQHFGLGYSGKNPGAALAGFHRTSTTWPVVGQVLWWLFLFPLALAAYAAVRMGKPTRKLAYNLSVFLAFVFLVGACSPAAPAEEASTPVSAYSVPPITPSTTTSPTTPDPTPTGPTLEQQRQTEERLAQAKLKEQEKKRAAAVLKERQAAARKAKERASQQRQKKIREERRQAAQAKHAAEVAERREAEAKRQAKQPQPSSGSTSYANCTAVREAGKAPLSAGDPGYSRKLDRDGDGVACEN